MAPRSALSLMVEQILSDLTPWSIDIIDRVFRYLELERDPDYTRLYWENRRLMGQQVINSTIARLVRQQIEKQLQVKLHDYNCSNCCSLIATGYTVLYGADIQTCSKEALNIECPNKHRFRQG